MSVSASFAASGSPSNTICPPLLAGAWAHVYHAVRRQHDGRVVLHHDQRVASIAQAVHGFDDAVHVRAGAGRWTRSSSTNSVLTSDVPSAVVRLMRCTSPPDSVRLWRSSVR